MIPLKAMRLVIWLGLVGALLSGCSSGNVNDLREYIAEVKASRKGQVEPLPEFIPTPSYRYAANDYGDPFVSWDAKMARAQAEEAAVASASSGLRPDERRRREPMENYPLDTLRMVGTMEREGERIVLVRSPEGLISRVSVGNYLGQNHGRVTAISEDKIDLIEIVSDGLGGWVERPASLALVE